MNGQAVDSKGRNNMGSRIEPLGTEPIHEKRIGIDRHPPGLAILFLTEMWERFSFYLLLGLLELYLSDTHKGGMGWSDDEAAVVVGSYIGLVYFTPFIGGLIADRLLGCRATIIIGGILMMLGHLSMAWPSEVGLFTGLGLLILGNGAFKPNISTLLGNLYPPGSPLKDSGYNIFYMGINLGAFICNFVAAIVRNYFDANPYYITSNWRIGGWHAAFATAAFGMFFGLMLFSFNYRRFADADRRTGTSKRESLMPLWLFCLLPAALMGAAGWFLSAHFTKEGEALKKLDEILPKAKEQDKGAMAELNDMAIKAGMTQDKFKEAIEQGDWDTAEQKIREVHDFWGLTSYLTSKGQGPPLGLKPPTAAFLGACIPVLLFYLRIWRMVPDPVGRGRVAALLVIFGVVIVFWMTFMLSSTALTVWIRDNTDRQTNAVTQLITDRVSFLAENASPNYFTNAGPEVPRPARSNFEVVSSQRYNELQAAKQHRSEDDKEYITNELLDKVYAKAGAGTPTLPPGEALKLANPELFLSINSGYIILFTPLLVMFWGWLRRLGKEPATPAKIGLGLLINAFGPLIMLGATVLSQDGATKASAAWLFGTYVPITIGELCLSPMGLSLVNEMAPASISAFMMGGWFLATSIGNKLSGICGEVYVRQELFHLKMDHNQFWLYLMICNALFGGVIFAILPWLNRQMVRKSNSS
jgi:dipeptide/tripeptide permease